MDKQRIDEILGQIADALSMAEGWTPEQLVERVKESIGDGKPFADKLFDAHRLSILLEDELGNEILKVIGIHHESPAVWFAAAADKFGSWTFDEYDSSFELSRVADDFRFTPEQLEQFWKMGFYQCWLNHQDRSETFYSRGSAEGSRKENCVKRDRDTTMLRNLRLQAELAAERENGRVLREALAMSLNFVSSEIAEERKSSMDQWLRPHLLELETAIKAALASGAQGQE